MLNLSDKELDRLAREAANEYDPGNQAGPGAWDRLQLRMDKELGNFRPNFFRSVRRIPFYYAPAILLLVGATYYFARPSRGHSRATPVASAAPPDATAKTEKSGSPPAAGTGAVRPLQAASDKSINNQKNTYKSTSTPYKENSNGNNDKALNPAFAPATGTATGNATRTATGTATRTVNGTATRTTTTTHTTNRRGQGRRNSSGHPTLPGQLASPGAAAPGQSASASDNAGNSGPEGHDQALTGPTTSRGRNHQRPDLHTAGNAGIASSVSPGILGNSDAGAAGSNIGAPSAATPGLLLSTIQGPQSPLLPEPVIDDAGLRKLGAGTEMAKAATPVNPGKKPSTSMHINRSLQLGFSLAPDFTSVNSLAGDKPGSSIGITADYQLLNRLHVHTGFLLSHKNYTAAEQDYHVPYDYYRMNNMHYVSFVKGTLNLWEIPLALRYDFSVTGNTIFFISGGASSYILTHENCNYYFDLFGRTARQEFKYGAHNLSLFSTVDLSMGVETGLSNNLSFLVAPYMKLPTTGLGFGKVEMNSVGIEFALKYTPVLRRKRH